MLRLLWRELHQPPPDASEEDFRRFHNEYDRLDRLSTSPCATFRMSLRSMPISARSR